eukprot:TRINITY_DN14537_c0_g1_i1.p1 TRINITY_DN14537_c0_g1~~TRINITY_DN14537_c0_g1_i1.p1  ORF type:complete len:147 (-),score=3.20 TRINITY_DN14537_c0_g1_i1:85-525(-)
MYLISQMSPSVSHVCVERLSNFRLQKGFIMFVDDFSRMIFPYFLKLRSEAYPVFKDFLCNEWRSREKLLYKKQIFTLCYTGLNAVRNLEQKKTILAALTCVWVFGVCPSNRQVNHSRSVIFHEEIMFNSTGRESLPEYVDLPIRCR